MTLTPEQGAVAEQAERETAFMRAREKLRHAFGAAEQERSVPTFSSMNFRRSVPAVVVGLLAIAFVLPIIALLWPLTALSAELVGGLVLLVAIFVGAAAFAWVPVATRWREGRPDCPENVIQEFFRRTKSPTGRARLGELVIQASTRPVGGRSLPQPVTQVEVTPAFDLARYWAALQVDDTGQQWRYTAESFKSLQVAHGLRLITMEVWRKPHSPMALFRVFLLGIVIAVCLSLTSLWVGREFGWKPPSGVATYVAMIPVFALMIREQKRSTKLRVNKLLVKCGNNWRMFNGEWEGWEEADLSWLDDPTVREIAAHPVSPSASRA